METLLAVDIGLRAGLALYAADGRLVWYRSQNFGNRSRLKRAVNGIVAKIPDLAFLVLEGGGPIADVWRRRAERGGIPVLPVSAELWRAELLYASERRNAAQAKRNADVLSRRVIEWSGAPRPTSLRHDAAEAILAGLWGVLHLGWLHGIPSELRK